MVEAPTMAAMEPTPRDANEVPMWERRDSSPRYFHGSGSQPSDSFYRKYLA